MMYALLSIISNSLHILFVLSINIKLFRDMLSRLFHAPINRYFDITPSGMILNRFSKDLQQTEQVLTEMVRSQIVSNVAIISSILLSMYNVFWVILFVPFTLLSLWYFFKLFRASSKEGARLESVSISPLITHLSETINGASTIRVYDKISDFENKQYELQNRNAASKILRRSISGWFNTNVNFVLTFFQSFLYVYCI